MQDKLIVGFSGKMGVGKTTLARGLCGALADKRVHAVRVSFADAIRAEMHTLYGIPVGLLLSQEGKSSPAPLAGTRQLGLDVVEKVLASFGGETPTVRGLMQAHGTARRKEDPDYWVKRAEYDIQKEPGLGPFSVIVFDDVRVKNEAEMIHENDGVLIRVDPYPEWYDAPHSDHITETDLDDFDGWELRFRPHLGGLDEFVEPLAEMVTGWRQVALAVGKILRMEVVTPFSELSND